MNHISASRMARSLLPSLRRAVREQPLPSYLDNSPVHGAGRNPTATQSGLASATKAIRAGQLLEPGPDDDAKDRRCRYLARRLGKGNSLFDAGQPKSVVVAAGPRFGPPCWRSEATRRTERSSWWPGNGISAAVSRSSGSQSLGGIKAGTEAGGAGPGAPTLLLLPGGLHLAAETRILHPWK